METAVSQVRQLFYTPEASDYRVISKTGLGLTVYIIWEQDNPPPPPPPDKKPPRTKAPDKKPPNNDEK